MKFHINQHLDLKYLESEFPICNLTLNRHWEWRKEVQPSAFEPDKVIIKQLFPNSQIVDNSTQDEYFLSKATPNVHIRLRHFFGNQPFGNNLEILYIEEANRLSSLKSNTFYENRVEGIGLNLTNKSDEIRIKKYIQSNNFSYVGKIAKDYKCINFVPRNFIEVKGRFHNYAVRRVSNTFINFQMQYHILFTKSGSKSTDSFPIRLEVESGMKLDNNKLIRLLAKLEKNFKLTPCLPKYTSLLD